MWGKGILGVWDNGRRNIKLDQTKLTEVCSLNENSVFNVIAWGVRNAVIVWLFS